MKPKLILDISIYMIAPIILCNVVSSEYLIYSITGLIAMVILYSLAIKQRETRVNISGLGFVSLCILVSLFRPQVELAYQVYVFDTYVLMLCGLVILLLTVLNKNIITRAYRDVQRAKGISNLTIFSSIKKCNLAPIFKQLSFILSGNLIIISLVKVYSISTYGRLNYTLTQDLEILIAIIFLVGEMYVVSKIISKSKEIMKKKKSKYKSKSKYQLNNSRVISLNQYKNANK